MSQLAQVATRVRANSNLAVLSGEAFLEGLQGAVLGVIWQPFVLSLGSSMAELGLLSSLGGNGGLVPTLIQPLGGWLADRSGRRPLLLFAPTVTILSFAFCIASALSRQPLLLVPAVVLTGLASISRPAFSALTAESVAESARGRAFSLLIVARMLPGILFPTLAGALAQSWGYSPLFAALIAISALILVLVSYFVRELAARAARFPTGRELGAMLFRSVIPPPGLAGFFLAFALDSFSWGLGWGILFGILTKTFGFDTAQLGILLTIQSVTWVIIQYPIGRFIDRRGTRSIMIFSEALGPPLMLIWLLARSFEMFALSQVLFATTAATWIPAANTFLAKHVPESERAQIFGRLFAFRGLIAFPAPFIGGLLFDAFGMPAPILANLAGSIVVVVILFLFVHEQPIPVRIAG